MTEAWMSDSEAVFKPAPWTVDQLVSAVSTGTLALPDLQRPFVWKATKVRDLLDSMYRGYPVGALMFWHRNGDESVSTIGTDAKTQSVTYQIVDGQQRITSLYSVMTGGAVYNDDYQEKTIRICFNPFAERFEVATPVFDSSVEWVSDVSHVFASALKSFKKFQHRYEEGNEPFDEDTENRLLSTFIKLESLKKYVFQVVELQVEVEKPVVADIFVRINSEGVSLKSADFILTWLSVFWDEGREQIEDFARGSRMSAELAAAFTGKQITWTPQNHHLTVDSGQIVRVAVAVGQNRGKLPDAYNALRGHDRKTGLADADKQARELAKLQAALPLVLNRLNWDEFLRTLTKAGFRSRKMITSANTVLYSYALWLIGRTRYNVAVDELRDLMARWFFMSQTTGRYTSSPETKIQQDLDRLADIPDGDGQGFKEVLNAVIDNTLTNDYWAIRLPDDLISSSQSASPAYQAYLAALNILEADLFALNDKMSHWLDPTATTVKDVETHHLFPKEYLKSQLGITDMKRINQIANFAPTDWATNILISDDPPSIYWPKLTAERSYLTGELLSRQQFWHALPPGWQDMDYSTFLDARRALMAKVIHAGYQRLSDATYQPDLSQAAEPVIEEPVVAIELHELIERGLLSTTSILQGAESEGDILAAITEDCQLEFNGETYDDLTRAARAAGFESGSGWDYWQTETDDGTQISLRQIAAEAGVN